eukprot:TRINITY_DN2336_c0_g1_i1.p1 TRINITY_DN2336_c0_g1~~TRINITY_DN2336_c0_g1_i1.p1  ORF type:complete len:638 (+),score=208.18 TRINITY_DN2336_c0_g1_i1:124-2037(+)
MRHLKGKKSKRVTLKQKYKVEKKVKEHHRKQRKLAKKNGTQKRLKKDPGIPNLWPWKEEMLHKIEKHREDKMDEAEDKRAKKRRLRAERKASGAAGGIEALAQSASSRGLAYDASAPERAASKGRDGSGVRLKADNSRKAYFKVFKKVIESADVILEVLDARDPAGCRSAAIEQHILNKDPSKKIILILNKIDLVPREVVQKWLTYLRNFYPTIAFKCSTQKQQDKRGQAKSVGGADTAADHVLNSSQCVGADTLIDLLKNYSRSKGIKTAITVGIIGYPNVGKSSLINSLKRSKATAVGGVAGLTKNAQEVSLDKKVKLLDCPGIVFADGNDPDVVLRNCVAIEKIEDPIAPVERIVERCRHEQLMSLYSIARFKDPTEFLFQIAQKKGKLGRGGVPDWKAAARSVLQDWNAGKIPFYTLPPREQHHVTSEDAVVSNWGADFDVNAATFGSEDAMLECLPSLTDTTSAARSYVPMVNSERMEDTTEMLRSIDNDGDQDDMDDDSDDDDSDSESESDEEEEVPSKKKRAGSGDTTLRPTNRKTIASADDTLNLQANKRQKQKQKKEKREMRRQGVNAFTNNSGGGDGNSGSVNDDGNDSYDFGSHFSSGADESYTNAEDDVSDSELLDDDEEMDDFE